MPNPKKKPEPFFEFRADDDAEPGNVFSSLARLLIELTQTKSSKSVDDDANVVEVP